MQRSVAGGGSVSFRANSAHGSGAAAAGLGHGEFSAVCHGDGPAENRIRLIGIEQIHARRGVGNEKADRRIHEIIDRHLVFHLLRTAGKHTQRQRNATAVIRDDRGIAAVAGFGADERFRPQPGDRVLCIEIENYNYGEKMI